MSFIFISRILIILNILKYTLSVEYQKNKDIKMTKKYTNPKIENITNTNFLQIKLDRKSTFVVVYFNEWAEKK